MKYFGGKTVDIGMTVSECSVNVLDIMKEVNVRDCSIEPNETLHLRYNRLTYTAADTILTVSNVSLLCAKGTDMNEI